MYILYFSLAWILIVTLAAQLIAFGLWIGSKNHPNLPRIVDQCDEVITAGMTHSKAPNQHYIGKVPIPIYGGKWFIQGYGVVPYWDPLHKKINEKYKSLINQFSEEMFNEYN